MSSATGFSTVDPRSVPRFHKSSYKLSQLFKSSNQHVVHRAPEFLLCNYSLADLFLRHRCAAARCAWMMQQQICSKSRRRTCGMSCCNFQDCIPKAAVESSRDFWCGRIDQRASSDMDCLWLPLSQQGASVIAAARVAATRIKAAAVIGTGIVAAGVTVAAGVAAAVVGGSSAAVIRSAAASAKIAGAAAAVLTSASAAIVIGAAAAVVAGGAAAVVVGGAVGVAVICCVVAPATGQVAAVVVSSAFLAVADSDKITNQHSVLDSNNAAID